MYCIKCGAKLSEGQTVCPICETRVYHPDFLVTESSTYPKIPFKSEAFNRTGLLFAITVLMLIPLFLPVILELNWKDEISWSGYVAGGVLLAYVSFILPCWFRHPNPVIFVPSSFAATAVYLFYICLMCEGDWFLPFALPLTGALMLIVTGVTALFRYLRRGRLYIAGGGFIAFGLFTLLLEYLLRVSLEIKFSFMWSVAPLTVFSIFGVLLIVVAIVKPFKESLRRVFFIGKA